MIFEVIANSLIFFYGRLVGVSAVLKRLEDHVGIAKYMDCEYPVFHALKVLCKFVVDFHGYFLTGRPKKAAFSGVFISEMGDCAS